MQHMPDWRFWRNRKLPVVLQMQASECGLACLGMILGYWGDLTGLSDLRQRFNVSSKGLTLYGIMDIGRACGLDSRPVRCELDLLKKLKLPAILHWDMNHFVVLENVGQKHVTIHDPAIGSRRLTWEEASKHFTGVALEVWPNAAFSDKPAVKEYRLFHLMGKVANLPQIATQLLTLGLILQLCALAVPWYLQWVVDNAIASRDTSLLLLLAAAFAVLIVLQAAINALRQWTTTIMSASISFQWLTNTLSHLLRLPAEYFEKRQIGDIVSRMSSVKEIQHALTTQFVEAIVDGVLVVVTVGIMAVYSPSLLAVTIVALVAYVGLRSLMYRNLKEANANQIILAAKQQSHLIESVSVLQSLRLFGKVSHRKIEWTNLLARQTDAEIGVAKYAVYFQMLSTLIFGLEKVAVIGLAATLVLRDQFTLGMLFAFLGYKEQFAQRATALVDKLFEWRILRLHGDRVADILLAPADPAQDERGAVEMFARGSDGRLELKDVSFRYGDHEPLVLKNITLTIEPGECIAVVGASGSGKTTLVKLLLGLLTPTSGEIVFSGIPLSSATLGAYRRHIGAVMQDDTLLAGTLLDNITFCDPSPDIARAENCARVAMIHEEISRIPMGYRSLIQSGGGGLSGGQRQRVLLARALYQQPGLLLLDEATSHLDIENERAVNAGIRALQLTRVLVAHRPQTIEMADRIVALKGGQIDDKDSRQQSARVVDLPASMSA